MPWLACDHATTTPNGSRLPTDVAHTPTHLPRSLPPRRVLPAVAHARVMGTPWGSSTAGRRSHSHESGRRPGAVVGLCSRHHHANWLKTACVTWRVRSHCGSADAGGPRPSPS